MTETLPDPERARETKLGAFEPGLYRNMTEAEYRAAPGLNISLLKVMARTPAHCFQELVAPVASTPTQELGQAFHAALLEPSKFHGEFFSGPGGDRRTKEGKALWANALAANPGKTALRADDYAWIERACEVLWKAPDVRALLGGPQGINEASAFWDWPVGETVVRSKGRIDRLTQLEQAGAAIVDVKTTGDASPDAFARDIVKWGYHAQAAYYRDGLDVISPRTRGWLWLVVEKEPPFAHAIYEPLPAVLEMGRALYQGWLARYVECAAAKEWPGYPAGVNPIDVPPWAYRAADLDF
jgi:exodeoxyribonuclease VIII